MSEVNVNILLERVWVKFHDAFSSVKVSTRIPTIPQTRAEHLLRVVSADLKCYAQYYIDSNRVEPAVAVDIRRLLGAHLWSSFTAVPQALLHWFSILPHVVDPDKKQLSNWSYSSVLPFLPIREDDEQPPPPDTATMSKISVRIGPSMKRRDPSLESDNEDKDVSSKRARVTESLDAREATAFPALKNNKEPFRYLVSRSLQQKPIAPAIDSVEELGQVPDDSRMDFAPPSPIASAFIEDVSTYSSSVVDSSSPPMSPVNHKRQLSVEKDEVASECSSIEILDFKFKAGPAHQGSSLDLSEKRGPTFRLIRSDHEPTVPPETKTEKISTGSQHETPTLSAFDYEQHPEVNPPPQQLTIEEVFGLTDRPSVPFSPCVSCARRGKPCLKTPKGRCQECTKLNLEDCDFARPEQEQLERRSVYGQVGQDSLFTLRESLAAAHQSRTQERRYASTWSHQAAITISHEIEAFNIISHICQNFRNHAEMITSICASPKVFQSMLRSFASANFSLSKGQAADSNSLYHVVHSLPDEVLVEYPVILRYFARRGHPLAAANLKKRDGDRLQDSIHSKSPTSNQGLYVTTAMHAPPVAGSSLDTTFVKKPSFASQVHVSVSSLSSSKNHESYRSGSSSSQIPAVRKSDTKK